MAYFWKPANISTEFERKLATESYDPGAWWSTKTKAAQTFDLYTTPGMVAFETRVANAEKAAGTYNDEQWQVGWTAGEEIPNPHAMTEETFKSKGYDRNGAIKWTPRMTEQRAQITAEEYDKRQHDNAIMERTSTPARTALGFGAALIASLPDPINLVPVGGMATKGAGLGARMLAGAKAGAVGTALADAVVLPAARARGEDVGFGTMALDMTFGALFGGVIGAGGHWLHNKRVRSMAPQEEALGRTLTDMGFDAAEASRRAHDVVNVLADTAQRTEKADAVRNWLGGVNRQDAGRLLDKAMATLVKGQDMDVASWAALLRGHEPVNGESLLPRGIAPGVQKTFAEMLSAVEKEGVPTVNFGKLSPDRLAALQAIERAGGMDILRDGQLVLPSNVVWGIFNKGTGVLRGHHTADQLADALVDAIRFDRNAPVPEGGKSLAKSLTRMQDDLIEKGFLERDKDTGNVRINAETSLGAERKRLIEEMVGAGENRERAESIANLHVAQALAFQKAYGVDAVKALGRRSVHRGIGLGEGEGVRLEQMEAAFGVKPESMQAVRDKYYGTDQWMKAPNGKDTNLNEHQWLQVRTPEFKNWFGDWELDPANASKVVDENGEPLVVYHQTEQQFEVFDISKARQDSDIPAFFFSSGTEDWAEMGGNTIAAFLNMRNPRDGKPSAQGKGREVRERLEREGYDGTIEREEDMETEFAVFRPEQVKSAIGNSGAFDPNNPNIFYQFYGEGGIRRLDEAESATRIADLDVARQMETAGKDAQAVKLATGWERGGDGKWRYEMPDAVFQNSFRDKLNTGKAIPLWRLLRGGKNNQLLKAYPSLAKYKIKLSDEAGNWRGYFSKETQTLVLSRDRTPEIESTAYHELQHAIQEAENFSRGGNPRQFPNYRRELDSLQEIYDAWRKDAKVDEFIEKSLADFKAKKKTVQQHFDDLEAFENSSEFAEQLKAAREQVQEYIDWYRGKYGTAYTPEEIYTRLIGEVEARNVQSRMGMTPEERRASLASATEDVARKDQILLGVRREEPNVLRQEAVEERMMELFQRAWHGTPYNFDRFTLEHIGKGEGAQAHGHGLYFAENRAIANDAYRERLIADGNRNKRLNIDGNTSWDLTNLLWELRSWDAKKVFSAIEKARKGEDVSVLIGKVVAGVEGNANVVKKIVELFTNVSERIKAGESYDSIFRSYDINSAEYMRLQGLYDNLNKGEGVSLEAFAEGLAKEIENNSALLNEELAKAKILRDTDWSKVDVAENKGQLFEVEIPENNVLLDEQLKLNKQPQEVQEAVRKLYVDVLGYNEDTFSKEAMFNAYDGRLFYRELADTLGSPEAASRALKESGVLGITYDGGLDGRCFVVFDDKSIQIYDKLYQAKKQAESEIPRGMVEMRRAEPGSAEETYRIFLGPNADASTVPHESAHIFHRELENVVARGGEGANIEQARADLKAIRRYAGVAEEGKLSADDYRKVQEAFARGFEQYLYEGKAPNAALEGVFRRMARWLASIYEDIKRYVAGTDGIELKDEIRQVYDRMLDPDRWNAGERMDEFSMEGARPDYSRPAPLPEVRPDTVENLERASDDILNEMGHSPIDYEATRLVESGQVSPEHMQQLNEANAALEHVDRVEEASLAALECIIGAVA